ncbi:3D domain-containing protein [Bacillus sp. AFS073361]|uniref:3D domain-containing protein n=1 Tax=Bacillus sp. AFS073361 TaxID=2033511 RepID=UPI00359C4B3C
MLTYNLLSPPSIVAGELANQVAPLAQEWRQQAEVLAQENERLRAENKRLRASQWRDFTATAYTADCPEGCIGITKTGLDVRNRTHLDGKRIIATDPSVIPLGTAVELRFSDGRTEQAVALDTGGAIKGEIIDYLISDNEKALQFGRQRIKIRIIK